MGIESAVGIGRLILSVSSSLRWVLWQIPYLPKFLGYPDLNGTWIGTLKSDWKGPDSDQKIDDIPAMLTIWQNWSKLRCRMETGEMTSQITHAFIERTCKPPELRYHYSTSPNQTVADRNTVHEGTAQLAIRTTPKRLLTGSYYTGRKTVGDINLAFRTGEHLDSVPDDMDPHPITEAGS